MKSFLYSPALSSIVLSRLLILSQSSVYFSNTSLFLSAEAKTKYLFPFFSSMYPSTSPTKKIQKTYTMNIHIIKTVVIYPVNKYQCFCMTFCLFLVSLN